MSSGTFDGTVWNFSGQHNFGGGSYFVRGQAGTSSRIENYLGFPSGVSGDELASRALLQARRLGAGIAIVASDLNQAMLDFAAAQKRADELNGRG